MSSHSFLNHFFSQHKSCSKILILSQESTLVSNSLHFIILHPLFSHLTSQIHFQTFSSKNKIKKWKLQKEETPSKILIFHSFNFRLRSSSYSSTTFRNNDESDNKLKTFDTDKDGIQASRSFSCFFRLF